MGFTSTITTNIAPAWDLVTRPLPLDYVCTRLTQPDPLMHFFSIIWLRGGLNNNLTVIQVKYKLRKRLFIKIGVVTASFLSNCSLFTSKILENLNCHVEKGSIDEETEIDIEIFCNKEELNGSNIDNECTNQCLAFIEGIVLWKLNFTLIESCSEKHCIILVKTL